jgi:hypothetical protein
VGDPFTCCTSSTPGTGSCQNASAATITAPASQNGAGWTLEDTQICGTDLLEAIYYRYVQSGDTAATEFTWTFNNATNDNFLGVGRITLFSGVGSTPIENEAAHCSLASSTLIAPSISITKANSVSVVMYGIVGNNSINAPGGGYDVIDQHNVAGQGPDIANYEKPFFSSGSTGTVTTTATTGDNLGFSLGLSPLP